MAETKTKSSKDASRLNFTYKYDKDITERTDLHDLLKVGCLQRIADALEKPCAPIDFAPVIKAIDEMNRATTKRLVSQEAKIISLKNRIKKLEENGSTNI